MVLSIHRRNNASFYNNREERPVSILSVKYRSSNDYSIIWEVVFIQCRLKNDDGIHSQYTNSWVGEEGGDDEGGIYEAL